MNISKLSENDLDTSMLKTQIQFKTQTIDLLQQQNNHQQQKIQELTNQLNNMTSSIQYNYQAVQQQSNTQKVFQKSYVVDINEQLQDFIKQKTEDEEFIQKLQFEITNNKSEIKHLKDTSQEMQQTLLNVQEENQQLKQNQEECDMYLKMKEKYETQNEYFKIANKTLVKQIVDNNCTIKHNISIIEQQAENIKQLNVQIVKYELQLKTGDSIKQEIKQENNNCQQLAQLQEQIQQQMNENAQLKDQNQNQEQQISLLQTNNQQKDCQIIELQQKIEKVSDELKNVQVQQSENKNKIENRQQQQQIHEICNQLKCNQNNLLETVSKLQSTSSQDQTVITALQRDKVELIDFLIKSGAMYQKHMDVALQQKQSTLKPEQKQEIQELQQSGKEFELSDNKKQNDDYW